MNTESAVTRIARLQGERRCLNCELPLTGRYCSQCGQAATAGRYSLVELIAGFFKDVWELDAPLLRTFRDLTVGPGRVTRGYLEGRREPYMSPLKYSVLFLSVVSLFGLLYGFDPFGGGEATNLPGWWSWVLRLQPLVITLALGWGLRVAFRSHEMRYAEHMILPLYALSHGGLVAFSTSLLISAVSNGTVTVNTLLVVLMSLAWLVAATPRFYEVRWLPAVSRLLLAYVLASLPLLVVSLGLLMATLP